jgi:hypothetical protein
MLTLILINVVDYVAVEKILTSMSHKLSYVCKADTTSDYPR